VLAAVIEAVSGRRYQDEVRLRIFQPLGLRDSGFLTDFGHHGVVRSVGYTSESNKTIDPDCNITVFAGSADMFSTVDDLSLWSQALMGNDFLTPAEKAKVFKAPSQYSYGFKLNDGAFWHRAFHTGYLPGFKSYISMNFTHGYSVIVLSNDSSQVVEAFGEDISTMLVSGKSKFL
jgi:CubicO group peptidase (beta-lactamase class C family)